MLPPGILFHIIYLKWVTSFFLNTGLPAGAYCDVISGNRIGNSCTGQTVTVESSNFAHFKISNFAEDPMVAIHSGSKLY